MIMKQEVSFVFGVAVSDYNFIGREEESRRLKMNFESGINTILISPRRWGKTSLVNHVRQQLNHESVIDVYLDMFTCRSEYDFYNALTVAVLKQTASRMDLWMENARDFLSRLTPKIAVNPDPNAEYSISLGITPRTHSPEEVLQLVEEIAKKKQKRIVVCIDEFQQIGEFPESIELQKRLRSVWQQQKHVSYCLFGSKRHLMSNIFQRRNMPLYQFGDTVFLKKIPTEKWVAYIINHFEEADRHISKALATSICEVVDNYSSYVQQLSWYIFLRLKEGEMATEEHLRLGVEDLLDANDLLFMQQIESLTSYQMNFLRAMLAGHTEGFGETAVRDEFGLGSSSNIARLKTALTERDLIETYGKQVTFADPVFRLWLSRKIQ